jgi:hypothetical protein
MTHARTQGDSYNCALTQARSQHVCTHHAGQARTHTPAQSLHTHTHTPFCTSLQHTHARAYAHKLTLNTLVERCVEARLMHAYTHAHMFKHPNTNTHT